MRLLACLMIALMPLGVLAQEKLQILPPDKQPRKLLYGFLQSEAQKHFDARKKRVASRHAPLLCSFFEDMALGDPLTCRLYHRRLWFRA